MPDYPASLALVTHQGRSYFKMEFREERVWKERFGFQPPFIPSIRALQKFVEAKVSQGHYLSGVRVLAVDGSLPKGRLRAEADGEIILDGDIAFFAHEPKPPAYPWKQDTQAAFWAIPFDSSLEGNRVGFFLTNGSKLEIFLDLDPASEKATIEIEVQGAIYYTMGGPAMPMPQKEKTASCDAKDSGL